MTNSRQLWQERQAKTEQAKKTGRAAAREWQKGQEDKHEKRAAEAALSHLDLEGSD
jgi:hypothetical protein